MLDFVWQISDFEPSGVCVFYYKSSYEWNFVVRILVKRGPAVWDKIKLKAGLYLPLIAKQLR